MEALILVDIQNDFLPGGALAVPRGEEIISVVNALQPYFPLIVATQDWHPVDHGSFASQHAGHRIGDQVELDGVRQVLWPDHCIQGSWGAEFAPTLYTGSIHRVFRKGMDRLVDSYSGFFDNQRRHTTGLGDYLKEQGVTDVYVAGLATDYCVQATALDALSLGFRTFVIEDACRGVDVQPGDSQRALERLQAAGVQRVTSARWLAGQGSTGDQVRVLGEGRFARLVERRRWEYAERKNAAAVVIIVAITDTQNVLLVEQYRVPVGRRCIELPAGLVGDQPHGQSEDVLEAVRRELWEETGFQAGHIRFLAELVPSAGLISETSRVYLATKLQQVGAGGGIEGERIILHRIAWEQLNGWLDRRAAQGYFLASSLYAGLWLAAKELGIRAFPLVEPS